MSLSPYNSTAMPQRLRYGVASSLLGGNDTFKTQSVNQDRPASQPASLYHQHQYEKLLGSLSTQPAHVASAFPFNWDGYDSITALSNDSAWMTFNAEKGKKRRHPVEKLVHKVSVAFHLSINSAREVIRDTSLGALFGAGVGLFISLFRFKGGIPDLLSERKFLGLLMMPGLPILGGLIGAAHSLYESSKYQANQLNEVFQTLLHFD